MQWPLISLFGVALIVLPGTVIGSSCSNGYVKCGDGTGSCVSAQYVCDGQNHCKDGSDEDQQLCSIWRQGSSRCGSSNIYCSNGNGCQSLWNGCNTYCSSDTRSSETCKIVKNKQLPEQHSRLELESLSRHKRWWYKWQIALSDDEDLFEGSAEGQTSPSIIVIDDQDADTVDMLAKAVKSNISEARCPMLYVKVGNHCVSFFSLAQVPWSEARQFCQSIHGDLLTVDDIYLYTGILDYLREKDLTTDYWLGGRYDMDLNGWSWLDDTPMPSNAPYWALRYSSSCKTRTEGGKCFNYVQLPEQSTQGYCAAITYENYFYFSDEQCQLKKSPLCLSLL